MTSNEALHILCLERTATPEQIKSAYRNRAKAYHPDINKDADAPRKFRLVQEAYELLKNGTPKASYRKKDANNPLDSSEAPYKVYEFINQHAGSATLIRSESSFPKGTVIHIAKGDRTFKFALDERKNLPFDATVGGLRLKFRNPPEGFDPRF